VVRRRVRRPQRGGRGHDGLPPRGLRDGDASLSGPVPQPRDPDVTRGPAAAISWLDRHVTRLVELAKAFGPDDADAWTATVELGGGELREDAGWVLRHAVHDLTHHLLDAGRGIHALGAGAPTQQGTVAQISASGGGVPKQAIEVVEVGRRGVVGDRQADRRNHGRPLQALCLWSTEVIDGLRAEGHPIGPGLAGENLTVTGIDWSTIRTGVQLLVGDVLCEISAFATPCAKNAPWFVERDFRRMDHDRHPGWSRAYAWVREPGTIRQGDPVVVEP
jgi:MOSC domain-containing protein YiiM